MKLKECPFDKNHKLEADKFLKHLERCKSQNRKNFVQCPYDPLHWINFNAIKQHEQTCKKQKKYEESMTQGDSVILELLGELEKAEEKMQVEMKVKVEEEAPMGKKKMKRMMREKEEAPEEKNEELWEEPSYEKWFKLHYGNKVIDSCSFSDSRSDFPNESLEQSQNESGFNFGD